MVDRPTILINPCETDAEQLSVMTHRHLDRWDNGGESGGSAMQSSADGNA